MEYRVRERLGRGATGVVDLAVDANGEEVALKHLVLHGSAAEMARARRRIRREAEVLARLTHPNVVRLLDVVDDGDEIVLVMPYLSGGTLADHVRARGPLAPGQVELVADSLLDGLAAAHREGVVHRDIKPANVLFDAHGRACLADFGIATLRDATSGLTGTGAIVGTTDYMAPEQARGESATSATDVFALGATLLFAATGEPPYGRVDPRGALHRAAKGRLAPLPSDLDPVLRRRLVPMVQRDPKRRPSAAAARGGVDGTGILGHPVRSRRAGPVAALVATSVVVVIAAATAAIVLLQGRSTSADDTPAEVAEPEVCTPLHYQPCNAAPAPGTDGRQCIEDRADYDGDPANGCEAVPDTADGTTFSSPILANLVPADDVDRYPTPVADELQLLCNGSFGVTLVAPRGASMRVDLVVDGEIVDSAASNDGRPAAVSVDDPNCWTSDRAEVVTRVSWVGTARTAEPYELRRDGSF